MKEVFYTLKYGVAAMFAQTEGPPRLRWPERTLWALIVVLGLSYSILGYLYLTDVSDYYFDKYQLRSFGLIVLAVFAAGFLPRLFHTDVRDQPYQLPVIVLALQIPCMLVEGVVWTCIHYGFPSYEINTYVWRSVLVLVQGVFLFRAFLICYGTAALPLQVRLFVTACLAMAALYYVPLKMGTPYFISAVYDDDDDGDAYAPVLNAEETLSLQPELVKQELSQIISSRPGQVDYYSVILGGDSSQDVFRKEAQTAQTAFDTYLGTKRRSVVLINNHDTVKTVPLGTLTNLNAVLAGLKTKLQPDEDGVIVYLTSHGGKDSQLVTYVPGISLMTVNAASVAKALEDNKFKWKIVIVSSCYSGTYVPKFNNPQSLIITAASSHTTSFGCSATADLTWFGQAFLTTALPESHSFKQLYDLTNQEILKREQEENVTPSLPQFKIGVQIADYLDKHPPFKKSR